MVKFVGAELVVLLLEAEFARVRVCMGSSLVAQLEGSFSSESASDYL